MSTTKPAPASAQDKASCGDLTFLLQHAAHVLTTELAAGLDGLGLFPRSHCVLSAAMDSGLTQIQLADRCDLDKTTMVVTLDELERRGLAERHPSPTDRRARIVVVTDLGRELVARGREIADRVHEDVLGSLPAAEREVFVSALRHLVAGRLSSPVACERTIRRRGQK